MRKAFEDLTTEHEKQRERANGPVEAVGPSGGADSFLSSAKHLMGDTGPSDTSPLKKEKAEKSQAASKHTEIEEKKESKSHSLCGHFGISHAVLYEVWAGWRCLTDACGRSHVN